MPSKAITKSVSGVYQKLLSDIAAIYDRAVQDMKAAAETILKDAHWRVGKRIVEVEQDGELRAAYGERLLEHISEDMTKTNRRGFSVSNLKNMRQVYHAFPIRQTSGELTWSHYVVLSSVKDKEERDAYLQRTIQKHWSVDELKVVLIKDEVKTLVSDGALKALAGPKSAGIEIVRLNVKRGILNTYRVLNPEDKKYGFNEDDREYICLDLGFRVYERTNLRLKDAGVAFETIVSARETAPGRWNIEKVNTKDFAAGSLLFTYAAQLEKVIDADTLSVWAGLRKGLAARKKLRLRRINAPEIKTAAGERARDFVVKRLKDCPKVVVKSYSTDIFDRYLADVFFLPDCDDPRRIATQGTLLNQELLNEGLADYWRTPDPVELAFLS